MDDYLTLYSEERFGDAILDIKQKKLRDLQAILTRTMALHKVGHSCYALMLLRNLDPLETLKVALRITCESGLKPSRTLLKAINTHRRYFEEDGLLWMVNRVAGRGDPEIPYCNIAEGADLSPLQMSDRLNYLWVSGDYVGAMNLCRWWQQLDSKSVTPIRHLMSFQIFMRENAAALATFQGAIPEMQLHPELILRRLQAQLALSPNENLYTEIACEFKKYPFHKRALWLYRKSVGWNSVRGLLAGHKSLLAVVQASG